jgi:hypothetical protein
MNESLRIFEPAYDYLLNQGRIGFYCTIASGQARRGSHSRHRQDHPRSSTYLTVRKGDVPFVLPPGKHEGRYQLAGS